MTQELSPRESYGKTLVDLGRSMPDLVVLDADLSPSTMTKYFAQQFPTRFFDCGLAEQNMIGIAAGLAAAGKTVFVSTFAVFAACRCLDQVRVCLAQPKLNVKVVATHGGISVGEDGASHHAIEDLAVFSALPGFTVIAPADAAEAVQAVKAAAATPGPFYIRLSRPKLPVIFDDGCPFKIGKAIVLREGSDVAIIAAGLMVARALEAAQRLGKQGLSCRVIDMATIKPLDVDAVTAAASTGAIVVAEEHLEQGGLGSRVAQVVAAHNPVPIAFVNLRDSYAKSGRAEDLLQRHGLGVEHIELAVRDAVARKRA